MAPFADVLFAMDRNWWNEYAESINVGMELWTSSRPAASVFGLNHIEAEHGGGVSKRAGVVRHGSNSGFQAVSLALHFGAARVILLGYDLSFDGLRKHWHGDHGSTIGNPLNERFAAWRKLFGELARESPVPIVNASRRTKLECFPRIDLETCLA